MMSYLTSSTHDRNVTKTLVARRHVSTYSASHLGDQSVWQVTRFFHVCTKCVTIKDFHFLKI